MMLQRDRPTDYVIGTGVMHSVRDLVEAAFDRVGLDWEKYVVVDQTLIRPAEVDVLCANPARARAELGWVPEVSFEELVADDGRRRSARDQFLVAPRAAAAASWPRRRHGVAAAAATGSRRW